MNSAIAAVRLPKILVLTKRPTAVPILQLVRGAGRPLQRLRGLGRPVQPKPASPPVTCAVRTLKRQR